MNRVQIRSIFDRKKEASSKKKGLLQIEIRYEKKRKFISTGIKLYKNQYRGGRIVNIDGAERLNERVNRQITEIEDLIDRLDSNKQKFSFDHLDQINEGYVHETFVDFIEKRIGERPTCISTQKQHHKVLNFLKNEYTLLTNFSDITYPNIILLDEYLKNER